MESPGAAVRDPNPRCCPTCGTTVFDNPFAEVVDGIAAHESGCAPAGWVYLVLPAAVYMTPYELEEPVTTSQMKQPPIAAEALHADAKHPDAESSSSLWRDEDFPPLCDTSTR